MKFLAIAISVAVCAFGMTPVYGQTVESTNSMQTARVTYNDPFATDKEVAMGNLADAIVASDGFLWKIEWTGADAMHKRISESLRNRIDKNNSLSPALRNNAKKYLAGLSGQIRLESEPIVAKTIADIKGMLRRFIRVVV